ncbi:hypothetical protein [Streptomyces halobius]|uniref:Uncharacterized protein n=1 Tax=Streptomyces halobius TaxID=2879846 RepID=A0ABY4MKT0_9ACTN|nr:hypothetical protein [Streptomyces halobius]UQA98205.1 hypothetical protein K9S39_38230 [Streptomyces halobius]
MNGGNSANRGRVLEQDGPRPERDLLAAIEVEPSAPTQRAEAGGVAAIGSG